MKKVLFAVALVMGLGSSVAFAGNMVSDVEIGVSPTFTTNVTLRLYFHRNIHKLNL